MPLASCSTYWQNAPLTSGTSSERASLASPTRGEGSTGRKRSGDRKAGAVVLLKLTGKNPAVIRARRTTLSRQIAQRLPGLAAEKGWPFKTLAVIHDLTGRSFYDTHSARLAHQSCDLTSSPYIQMPRDCTRQVAALVCGRRNLLEESYLGASCASESGWDSLVEHEPLRSQNDTAIGRIVRQRQFDSGIAAANRARGASYQHR